MGWESLKRFSLLCLAISLLVMCGETYTEDELFQQGMNARVQEQYEEAIERFSQLVEEYPESDQAAQALFLMGYLYANDLKDYEKAATYYQRYVDQYPDHEMASSAQWELDNLGKNPEDVIGNTQN
jgi:TolA-binding protein